MLSTGWLIALGLLVLYILFIFWLIQTNRLAKWNLSLMLGIVLMVRTQRGKKLIDWIARPKRFWNFFGDLGTILTLLGLVAMTVLMLATVLVSLNPASGVPALGASEILVIPGVNPFVPLWYGLIALIVTLVVHEGGHGILARANGMRLKSLGLLIAVVPIGAFVEPDEEDLKAAPRRRRLAVFGAGPAINIAVAFLCLGGMAGLAGQLEERPGIYLASIGQDSPAETAGMAGGDILLAGNGETFGEWAVFQDFMQAKNPGDAIEFAMGDGENRVVTLGSRWDSLSASQQEALVAENATLAEEYQRAAYLGVSPLFPERLTFLAHPFGEGGINFLVLISAPIGEVRGIPYLSTYFPAFHEAPFNPDVYWPMVNLLFWVFWINLMVGLTNILPMLPLDGGHIFRDAASGVLEKLRPGMDALRREKVVGWTAGSMSLIILTALVLQILGPRIVGGF